MGSNLATLERMLVEGDNRRRLKYAFDNTQPALELIRKTMLMRAESGNPMTEEEAGLAIGILSDPVKAHRFARAGAERTHTQRKAERSQSLRDRLDTIDEQHPMRAPWKEGGSGRGLLPWSYDVLSGIPQGWKTISGNINGDFVAEDITGQDVWDATRMPFVGAAGLSGEGLSYLWSKATGKPYGFGEVMNRAMEQTGLDEMSPQAEAMLNVVGLTPYTKLVPGVGRATAALPGDVARAGRGFAEASGQTAPHIFTTGQRTAKVGPGVAKGMAATGNYTQEQIWDQTGWWVDVPSDPKSVRVPGGEPLREIPDPPDLRLVERTPEGVRAEQIRIEKIELGQAQAQQAADIAQSVIDRRLAGPQAMILAKQQAAAANLPPYMQQQVVAMVQSGKAQVPKLNTGTFLPPGDAPFNTPSRAEHRFPHPALYEEHPELADVKFSLKEPLPNSGLRGEYRSMNNETDVYTRDPASPEATSTGIHEMGHGVQHRAGMTTGGSPDTARSILHRAYLEGLVDDEMFTKLDAMSDYELYLRIGGESLSRLSENRWMGTPYNYVDPYPWKNLDVPADEIFWSK